MPTRRSTEHGLRKFPRLALADIPQDQSYRATDCGVCPVARTAEGSLGVVKSKFPDHRSADNRQRRTAECAALGTQNVKGRVQHRFQSGKHDRDILRLAASHGTVDCDLLNGRDSLARRDDAEYFVR